MYVAHSQFEGIQFATSLKERPSTLEEVVVVVSHLLFTYVFRNSNLNTTTSGLVVPCPKDQD
jgi:hypothetical protein